MKILLPILLLLVGGCVSVPLPQLVIPKKKQDIQGFATLGTNGLAFNLAYSPDSRWIFNVAGNGKTSIWTPKSLSAEGGFGWISKGHKLMLSLNYGAGSFRLNPDYSTGSDYRIVYMVGTFRKATVGLSALLAHHIGISLRLSDSWGTVFVKKTDFDAKNDHTLNFQVLPGLEGLLYFELTKQRNLLLCIGAASSQASDFYESRLDYEGLTYPMPFFLAVGYRFGNGR